MIIKLPIAAQQCLKALLRGEGTACEARRTSPYCLSGSEFTGECVELAANFILRRGVVGSRGAAHKKKMLKCGKYKSLIVVGGDGRW